jgi:hypothetical protein
MGHDSSDFMTCDKCKCYEIDQRGQSAGVESGIIFCTKHTFCKNCYPQAFRDIELSFKNIEMIRKYGKHQLSWYDLDENSTDEEIQAVIDGEGMHESMEEAYLSKGLPKEFCPMCAKEGKKKKKEVQDREIIAFLLKKVGMTRQQVCKEMNKRV